MGPPGFAWFICPGMAPAIPPGIQGGTLDSILQTLALHVTQDQQVGARVAATAPAPSDSTVRVSVPASTPMAISKGQHTPSLPKYRGQSWALDPIPTGLCSNVPSSGIITRLVRRGCYYVTKRSYRRGPSPGLQWLLFTVFPRTRKDRRPMTYSKP